VRLCYYVDASTFCEIANDMPPSTQKERAQTLRREKLADIERAQGDGSLVIRQMTKKELALYARREPATSKSCRTTVAVK